MEKKSTLLFRTSANIGGTDSIDVTVASNGLYCQQKVQMDGAVSHSADKVDTSKNWV